MGLNFKCENVTDAIQLHLSENCSIGCWLPCQWESIQCDVRRDCTATFNAFYMISVVTVLGISVQYISQTNDFTHVMRLLPSQAAC